MPPSRGSGPQVPPTLSAGAKNGRLQRRRVHPLALLVTLGIGVVWVTYGVTEAFELSPGALQGVQAAAAGVCVGLAYYAGALSEARHARRTEDGRDAVARSAPR